MTLPATLYPSQLNSVSTTLNGSLAQASTSVTVTTVGNLLGNGSCPYLVMIGPSTGFDSTTEICICTGVSGSVLTITRAQGGSTAPSSWASGSLIACNFSSLHWTNLVTDMNYLAAVPWTALTSTTDFSTTAPSTSTITMNTDQTANIKVGTRIKMTFNSGTQYGQVTAITSALLTFRGQAITTGAGLLTALSWGDSSRNWHKTFNIPMYYESVSTSTAINDRINGTGGYLWDDDPVYIIGLDIQNGTADSGATQAIINAVINGNLLDTSNSNNGLSISGTSLVRSVVDINATLANTLLSRGQVVEIKITKGTNGDGQYLTVTILGVLP
jgi:hypothetical protein